MLTNIDQPDLFDPARWPRRPYCTDDLNAGLRIRSRVWGLYDIDRP